MEFSRYCFLIVNRECLQIRLAFTVLFNIFFKDSLGIFKIICNDVAVVSILVVLRKRLWKLVVAWVQQDVATVFLLLGTVSFIHHDFQREQQKPVILVNVISDLAEPSVCVILRNLDSVYFELLSLPILLEPLVVRIVFLLFQEHIDLVRV